MYQWVISGVMLSVCAWTDLRRHRIYHIVLFCYLGMALLGHLLGKTAGPAGVASGMLPGLFCLLVSWATRQGLGYGDSLLIVICGVSLGLRPCAAIAVTAFFLAGFWAALLLILRRGGRKKEIPFVPFLLLGLLICRTGGI